MNHDQATRLIGPYLDGEIDLTTSVDIEEHLAACESCRQKIEAQHELLDLIRTQTPRFAPPPFLPTRIRATLREQQQQSPSRPFWRTLSSTWLTAGLAIAAILLIAAYIARPPAFPPVIQEAIADHVRSLQVTHLMDVASTDQHTVKPWFAGKLDYSPPVIDLAPSGYPLIGGRLDVLDSRTVAAIIYQRRKHYINLFIWPSSRPIPAHLYLHNGYHLQSWTRSGMNYLAISDVAEPDFRDFTKQIQAQTPDTQPIQ